MKSDPFKNSALHEDSNAASLIGFFKATRGVAIQLGVDPYSSNETLQRELNGIAWAAYAGKMAFTVATMPIGGEAGLALTAAGVINTLDKTLLDQSPSDLWLRDLKALLAMGCDRAVADSFLYSTAFSLSVQTGFIRRTASRQHGISSYAVALGGRRLALSEVRLHLRRLH